MKATVAILAVLLGLAVATRERRQVQAGCPDPFQNVPSPCSSAPNTQFYFPHPTDNTKFLQCDIYKRMYIIQCPRGEVYDVSQTACRPATVATAGPYVPPVVVTRPPQTVKPVITFNNGNPCVQSAITRGLIYFPVSGDKTKFIECDLAGNPNALSCPTGLLWDQGMLSCVYPINAGTNTGNPGSGGVTNPLGSIPNPCTAAALNSGRFFFPHPNSASKFIQCNQYGQGFPVDCPSGLIWNAYLETCYRPLPGSG